MIWQWGERAQPGVWRKTPSRRRLRGFWGVAPSRQRIPGFRIKTLIFAHFFIEKGHAVSAVTTNNAKIFSQLTVCLKAEAWLI